ncbi:MAG TPA: PHB depolymerase family esterase [Polyangiaceae bacterium]|nr:PHB depolymerase family esterase [Polyangiaceae bacterium]
MKKKLLYRALLVVAGAAPFGCDVADEPPSDDVLSSRDELEAVTNFGTNPGNLKMNRHVPAGVPANAALIVALHGCSQPVSAYASSGWNQLADQHKFYVVYPEQQSANNSALCFNWFGKFNQPSDKLNVLRNTGENASIKQMVDKMKADFSIDPSRVFVTGFSAGAGMASVMLAAWPDVFRGGAIIAGLPYNPPAQTNAEVFQVMSPGKDLTPAQWGDRVRNAFPGYAGPYPRVSVWHGTSDTTVAPLNQREIVEQWTNVHGLPPTPTSTGPVAAHTRKVFADAQGKALVESYELKSIGHTIAADPPNGCGQIASFVSDTDICSTRLIADFLGLTQPPVTDQRPTVNVTAPANGSTVSGTVTVTAAAADDQGVARVEFFVDGDLVATDTTAPYSFAWDTAAESNGPHALRAVAFDTAGQSTADNDTQVNVTGGVADTTPPVTTATPAGGTFTQPVSVSLSANEPATTFFTLDGSAPTTGSPQFSAPVTIGATATLRFFSVDAAGNAEAPKSASFVIQAAPGQTFASLAAEDGSVGSGFAPGTGVASHRVGDSGMFNANSYRTILSFDTSALPDNAQVTKAVLRVTRKSLTGAVSAVSSDIKSGAFGAGPELVSTDYSAAASAVQVGSFAVPAADGGVAEVTLSAAALPFINKTGRTQIRLAGTSAVDFASDLFELFGGEDGASAPTLTVSF